MDVDDIAEAAPLNYMQISWDTIFDGVTTVVLRLNTRDVTFLVTLLHRAVRLRRLDLRQSKSSLASSFNHIILRYDGLFPEMEVVLLGSPVTASNIEQMLRKRKAGSAGVHIFLPDTGGMVEHFLLRNVVRSNIVSYPIDYWSDPCIVP
jgi:hypothetical protein